MGRHEIRSVSQVSLVVNFELMQKLLMIADQVEVLSPESVKEKLREKIENARILNVILNDIMP